MAQQPASAERSARRWRAPAALLVVVALALGAAGVARHDPKSASARSPLAPRTSAAAPLSTLPALPPGTRPTSVEITSIGVSARIRPMGLNPDRTVEVPADSDEVGWYSLGPMPGQSGSAVLLGHVDSTSGPAVFARLRQLAPGAEVRVRRSDGSSARFEVRRTATYPNKAFPARKVYRATGRPGIALVTCGGPYDAARGGYQANVVVYADLTGAFGPTAAS